MTRSFPRLLLTTALCLPMASAAFAQSEAACDDLAVALNDGLPTAMNEDMQRITDVQAAGDTAACKVEVVAIRTATASDNDTAQDGEQLVESDQLTVRLQDELTVQGMVYLDRQPANVDIQGGDTEVTVTDAQPDVTVNEGQANIVIRQAAANVVVEMPQPTIRIEQPAPEIIITMPAPGVDVANARPQVEVRQAQPTVTVTQASPKVDLELQSVPEGETASTTVTDRNTGATYGAGETGDATALDDAEVTMAQKEPTVIYQDGEAKTPTINRAEPQVTFESADPQVQVTSMGEPQIEMVQTGEPVITFQNADAGNTAPAADATDTAETETDAAMATDPAMTDTAATDAPDDVAPITQDGAAALSTDGEATDTTDMAATDPATADADVVDPATDTSASMAPAVTREGYTAMPTADMNVDTLRGMRVYGTGDENVGTVGEVLTAADGTVDSLVLEVGGFLGLGQRSVQVPMNMLTILSDANGDTRVYVDATEDRLEDMPQYDG